MQNADVPRRTDRICLRNHRTYIIIPRGNIARETAHFSVDGSSAEIAEGDVQQVGHDDARSLEGGGPDHKVLAVSRCYTWPQKGKKGTRTEEIKTRKIVQLKSQTECVAEWNVRA